MVRVNRVLSVAVLGVIACGPPQVVGPTEGETTGDELADSSTGMSGTESSETGQATTTTMTTASSTFTPERRDIGPIACDPYAQDCPEGEKCVAYASTGTGWDANKCVQVMGDRAPGEPCTYAGIVEATDDCDETSACWYAVDVGGELIGTCLDFCTGNENAPECPINSSCIVSSGFAPNLCIPNCHPFAQDCNAGLACYWAGIDFNCIPTTQDIPVGQPCGNINDCAGGLICLAADTLPSCADAACCSAFCDLSLGDAPCDAQLPGTACVPFFEQDQAPLGYEQVGICILPG